MFKNKNKLIKSISFLFVFCSCFFVFSESASAISSDLQAGGYGLKEAKTQAGERLPENIMGETVIVSAAGKVIGIALSYVGVLFFILVLYAGFTWMMARGDSGKVDKAKSLLEKAFIGLLIVLAAYSIANFVFSNLVPEGSGSVSSSAEDGIADLFAQSP